MGAVLAHSSLGAWAAAVIALTVAHKPARVRADSTRRECPRLRRGRRSRPVWVAVHAVGAVGAHWKLKAGTAIVVARSRTECRGRGRHFSPVKDCCGRILGAQAQDGSNEQEVEEEAPASHCFEADFGEGEAGRRPVRRAAPVCVFRRVLFGRAIYCRRTRGLGEVGKSQLAHHDAPLGSARQALRTSVLGFERLLVRRSAVLGNCELKNAFLFAYFDF